MCCFPCYAVGKLMDCIKPGEKNHPNFGVKEPIHDFTNACVIRMIGCLNCSGTLPFFNRIEDFNMGFKIIAIFIIIINYYAAG